jgi:hypothetical protein
MGWPHTNNRINEQSDKQSDNTNNLINELSDQQSDDTNNHFFRKVTVTSCSGSPAIGSFHCGVDSPVSTASSVIHWPQIRSASAGTTASPSCFDVAVEWGWMTEKTSPGSSISPGMQRHVPLRSTCTSSS